MQSLFTFTASYLVYLRTHDKRYLDHIKAWIDLHIDDKGVINRPIDALDYILPGNLLLILYKETKEEKYKLAAESIRKVFDTIRAPATVVSGMRRQSAATGSFGLTGYSCRFPFWFATARCLATVLTQMPKRRSKCLSTTST